MYYYWFTIFVLGSYVISVATSSVFNKHSTFYSIRFEGQEEKASQPLVKDAVECARHCMSNLPECYGFGIEPSTASCQAYAIPTLNVSGVSLSDLGQEKAFYDRVPQCPYWNDFLEVRVNNTNFCIAIESSANVSFSEASSLCQAKGGYLLRMDNLDKYDAILTVKDALGVDQLKYWIGASDQLVEGQWVHEVDGQPIDHSVFIWSSDYNTDHDNGEDCAALHGTDRDDIRINDRRCFQQRGFICEAQLQ